MAAAAAAVFEHSKDSTPVQKKQKNKKASDSQPARQTDRETGKDRILVQFL